MSNKSQNKFSQILSVCKARGFLFPSSEIYGGLNSCWDYGPLGVQLKNNLKKQWWENMTKRSDVTGLDASIFMHPKVWEASGHLDGFTDPLSDCRDCKHRFRLEEGMTTCPNCGSKNITESRDFNLMFKSFMGPLEAESSTVYLRPETAQGIYVNFLNVQQSMRLKIPFGMAQIGKAFRNEITPSHSIFRTREFEQMEMQFFTSKKESARWFDYWREERMQHLLSLGFKETELHFKVHEKEELAHYAQKAEDIEFDFPWGRRELEGLHNRGDFDLSQHQKFSGKKLQYFCPVENKSYLPYVIETSIGVDRLFLAILSSAYKEENVNNETRKLFKLSSHIAPVQIAVLPLSKKSALLEIAESLSSDLQKEWFVEYDSSGSIGKRYRRQDEIGTPFCATIDFESCEDNKLTIRYRDSMKQERISIESLNNFLKDNFK
ncbi:MAG: glycine--tRNA ligase [Bdellovibrionaceae bacterium]|nr:glycine--tRNA ligase [Pseudobdellovibrionaceae bacterium]